MSQFGDVLTSHPRPVRWHEPLVAFLSYLSIALAFFGPVLSRLSDQLITSPTEHRPWDALQVLWNAWWVRRSLFAGVNPYFCDMLFVPYGTPLVLHTLTPAQTSAIALLSSILPTALSYNVVVITGFPVAGLGAYALCRLVTRHHVASLVGGLAFMLSPFLVSKAVAGWVNMVYSGVLPLYLACLLHSTAGAPARPRLSRALLAGSALLVLFTGDVTVVFAANLTVCAFVWQSWTSRSPRQTAIRFIHALGPTALVVGPYLAMVAYYAFSYGLTVSSGRELKYTPDVLSYALPFTDTSLYSRYLTHLNLPAAVRRDLVRADNACYLGLLVLPLALFGLVSARKNPTVRFFIWLFLLFLVLSLGTELLLFREAVHVGPVEVRLPFLLWEKIPMLGAVAQTGRYLVISYMAMSVGLACLVSALWDRLGERWGTAAAATVALIVCADFAFVPGVGPVPPVPSLSGRGVVLDPRLHNAPTMYYQTHHERPLMGGYVSRRPAASLGRYRQIPGFTCLFFGDRSGGCDRALLLSSLRTLGVTDILMDPGDWRGDMLRRYGFCEHYADSETVVWAVPGDEPRCGSAAPSRTSSRRQTWTASFEKGEERASSVSSSEPAGENQKAEGHQVEGDQSARDLPGLSDRLFAAAAGHYRSAAQQGGVIKAIDDVVRGGSVP